MNIKKQGIIFFMGTIKNDVTMLNVFTSKHVTKVSMFLLCSFGNYIFFGAMDLLLIIRDRSESGVVSLEKF